MQLIDEVIETIKDLHYCGGAYVLAEALASACSSQYKISCLDVSVNLDAGNKAFVIRLMQITREPDYSNSSQDSALSWLSKNKYI